MSSKTTSGKSITMAELLARSKNKVRGFTPGQKVSAKVIAKTPKSVVFDIGGKSEGLLVDKAFAEAKSYAKTLNIGEEVEANVLIGETKEGYTILSLRQAASESLWRRLEEAKKKDLPVAVIGRGVNPSGVTVEVEGLIGFIPGSQLGKEVAKNTESLVGKYFKAKVLEVDKNTNKIVLSEKEVSEAADMKVAKEALESVKEGQILDGKVSTIANFGCFVEVEIPAGKKETKIEGLVHISELSWGRVASVEDVVKLGDKVKVMVIGKSGNKLSLSLRQAQKDPWEKAEEKYKPDTKVKGKVVKISDFGVFVEVEPGIEGLIHITKIPPATKFREGQETKCFVEEIDSKNKKLSLGLILTSKPVGYK